MRARNFDAEEIERVVVRGASWVGDAVMTVPALRELRRVLPLAHITLATRSWAEGIFADADFLDDLMIEDQPQRGPRAFIRQRRQWRDKRFDLAILFQNSFQSAFIAAAARIPVRVGYATDGRRVLLTHAVAVPAWRGERHAVFYYLNLIASLERSMKGASDIKNQIPHCDLFVSDARKTRAREILRENGARLNRPLVALCPGSTNSRAKRWPTERYAALADRLIEEAGADVVIIGSREELDVTQDMIAQMRQQPIVLTGQVELEQTTAVLSVSDLLVTNDTGPAHIAAALNRPTLVIFGPTNPVQTRPFSSTAVVIRHPPDCAPCMLRDCPIDHRCMTAISPAEVFERAVELIARQEQMEVRRG